MLTLNNNILTYPIIQNFRFSFDAAWLGGGIWWYQAIKSLGFEMVEDGHSVYVKRKKECLFTYLSFGDKLLAGNNSEILEETKSCIVYF